MNPLDVVVKVIRCNSTDPDPALDLEQPRAVGEYAVSRDSEKAPLREGVEPCWLYVRRLPAAWMATVLDGVFPLAARRVLAFRAAVQRVEPPGDAAMVAEVEAAQLGVQLAKEAWVQEVADRFGSEVLQELGQVAMDLSRLPRGKRGPFSYWGGTVASP